MQTVLFLGEFCTGKTTLIHALLRKRILSDEIIRADWRLPVRILYGEKDEVLISYNHNLPDKKIDRKMYLQMCRNTEDQEEGLLFHACQVTYYCQSQGPDLCFFLFPYDAIESNDMAVEHRFTKGMEADAIVYLINSTMAFSSCSRKQIKDILSNCKNTKLFFVLTRIDMLEPEMTDSLKEYTERLLKDIYTIDGEFNRKLYSSRVFFTDTWSSLKIRSGEDMRQLPEGHMIPKDDSFTGVPEFEYNLRKYLLDLTIKN